MSASAECLDLLLHTGWGRWDCFKYSRRGRSSPTSTHRLAFANPKIKPVADRWRMRSLGKVRLDGVGWRCYGAAPRKPILTLEHLVLDARRTMSRYRSCGPSLVHAPIVGRDSSWLARSSPEPTAMAAVGDDSPLVPRETNRDGGGRLLRKPAGSRTKQRRISTWGLRPEPRFPSHFEEVVRWSWEIMISSSREPGSTA